MPPPRRQVAPPRDRPTNAVATRTPGDADVSGAGDDVTRDMCEVRCIDAVAVTRVRAQMPRAQEVAVAAERLKLLGDPTRLRLLAALSRAEELCVCDLTLLAAAGGGSVVSESAVSHALRGLRLAGMVRYRRARKIAYYRLADASVRQLVRDLFGRPHAQEVAELEDATVGDRSA